MDCKNIIIFGYIGPNIIRTANQILGQYVVDKLLYKELRKCYKRVSLQTKIRFINQEYNSTIFIADKFPGYKQMNYIFETLNTHVHAAIQTFYVKAAKACNNRQIAAVSVEKKLISNRFFAIYTGIARLCYTTINELHCQTITRCAIASASAARVSVCKSKPWCIADCADIVFYINLYEELLEYLWCTKHDGHFVVLQDKLGHKIINPKIISAYRSKTISGNIIYIIGYAINMLNCLDWVQKSKFYDIPYVCSISNNKTMLVKNNFVYKVKNKVAEYATIEKKLSIHSGALFLVDIKNFFVQCYAIREKAARYVAKKENIQMDDIIDTIINIESEIQNMRTVLYTVKGIVLGFLKDKKITGNTVAHIGGDDAIFFVYTEAGFLTHDHLHALGNIIAEKCHSLRIAYCIAERKSNLAHKITILDRTSTVTKLI